MLLHWSPSEVDDEEQANGNAVKADEKERMKEGDSEIVVRSSLSSC